MPLLAHQLDDLAASVRVLARSHAGRLAALTVGLPATVDAFELSEGLSTRLAATGHPGVIVRARAARPLRGTDGGPLRIVAIEFES